MRAVRCERQGPPEEMKLVELPDPVPAAGEAVVRLYACGLNRRDVWIRQGLYARIRLPCVLGADGAGVAEAAGPGGDPKPGGKPAHPIPSEPWGPGPAVHEKAMPITASPQAG